jgi:hypothetical protein
MMLRTPDRHLQDDGQVRFTSPHMKANAQLIARIQTSLNANVIGLTALSGGSIASSYRADLDGGECVFVKTSPQHRDMFLKEANGLNELRTADALLIPEVIIGNRRGPDNGIPSGVRPFGSFPVLRRVRKTVRTSAQENE